MKIERKLSDSTGMKRQTGGVEKSANAIVKQKGVEEAPKSKSPKAPVTSAKNYLSESSTVESPKIPLPPETLHWKDTPKLKRARRASLPYGVKLMEIVPPPQPLPEIKDGKCVCMCVCACAYTVYEDDN